jgi:hypothetical protein
MAVPLALDRRAAGPNFAEDFGELSRAASLGRLRMLRWLADHRAASDNPALRPKLMLQMATSIA